MVGVPLGAFSVGFINAENNLIPPSAGYTKGEWFFVQCAEIYFARREILLMLLTISGGWYNVVKGRKVTAL